MAAVIAAAVYKPDHSVLCAKVYIPTSKSFITSLIDAAKRQIMTLNQTSGSIQIEDYVILFSIFDNRLAIIVATEEANLQEVNQLMDILVFSL